MTRSTWLEHRFKLRLFVEPPAGSISEDTVAEPVPEQEDADEQEDAGRRQYYIQSPDLVHKLLDVNRYAQRWPLIPQEELHASSIEHPSLKDSDGNKCRWLLHTRRVPVLPTPSGASDSGMSQPVNASSLPICAGVGDPEAYVWACWDCVNDLCAKKPIMPSNGLTNDNWIGRVGSISEDTAAEPVPTVLLR